MDSFLALGIKNKIFQNDYFKKNIQKTGSFEVELADGVVCTIYPINLNYKDMMLISLVLLCAVMFWLLYKSVEFFDKI
ncbi:hypothetical protein CEY12_19585 [Chryseobacterium sp. T16E-39]|uniref:hypothetical protein n=1 Tax=Chryseobacterium sp. T16E-39 TaxID=2015076 RepID=UPI000B5B154D|nr:hypothetical protein [Chryseobacterium sp. T16E-39]ASK32160.1 hypothetical protein CEY12_19585 [Chryseobacterium sp. T16E-39]